jgi:hypothetical protein
VELIGPDVNGEESGKSCREIERYKVMFEHGHGSMGVN